MNTLDALSPISLVELDERASLRRRVDQKYLVERAVFDRFLDAATESFAVLEIDGRRRFAYRSLYFDTPDAATFRAHVQGRRRRFKCRRRTYLDTRDAAFEVKLKGPRGETVKRRLRVDPTDEQSLSSEEWAFLDEVLTAAYGQHAPASLVPTLEIRYERVTLVSLTGVERVTCDFELAASSLAGAAVDPTSLVVIESKTLAGHGASDRILRGLGARPTRISKYVVATAAAGPYRANDFRRAIGRLAAPESRRE